MPPLPFSPNRTAQLFPVFSLFLALLSSPLYLPNCPDAHSGFKLMIRMPWLQLQVHSTMSCSSVFFFIIFKVGGHVGSPFPTIPNYYFLFSWKKKKIPVPLVPNDSTIASSPALFHMALGHPLSTPETRARQSWLTVFLTHKHVQYITKKKSADNSSLYWCVLLLPIPSYPKLQHQPPCCSKWYHHHSSYSCPRFFLLLLSFYSTSKF